MDTGVLELVEMLYSMVTEAWGVPLGNEKCIIERDTVLNILDEIKSQMPAELAEAKRLVFARDEFIAGAKREADSIRRVAEEQARHIVDDQEIVRAARAKSSEMIKTAEEKSEDVRRAANRYVDDVLKRTEEAVTAALEEIRKSQMRFRKAAGTQRVSESGLISDNEFFE